MASTNPSGTSNEQFWQGATNPKPPKKRSLLKIIGILAAVLVVAIVVLVALIPTIASSMAPGIDQIPEALLPLALVARSLDLSWADIVLGTVLFWGGSLVLSRAAYAVGIRDRPY